MEKVILYEFKDANISVIMSVYFNDANKLIFEGYDIGKKVANVMHKTVYEYFYSIESEEVKKIATLLNSSINDKTVLLQAIKARFNKNDAYTKFGNFMKENNITFTRFTQ